MHIELYSSTQPKYWGCEFRFILGIP